MSAEPASPRERAKAEAQRQQAALDELKADARDRSKNYRPCEIVALIREQQKAVNEAWAYYRSLHNTKGAN